MPMKQRLETEVLSLPLLKRICLIIGSESIIMLIIKPNDFLFYCFEINVCYINWNERVTLIFDFICCEIWRFSQNVQYAASYLFVIQRRNNMYLCWYVPPVGFQKREWLKNHVLCPYHQIRRNEIENRYLFLFRLIWNYNDLWGYFVIDKHAPCFTFSRGKFRGTVWFEHRISGSTFSNLFAIIEGFDHSVS